MTGKIFRSILLVAGTVLAASLLVIMGCLYEYFGGVEQKQLRDEYIAEYRANLKAQLDNTTIVEPDGTKHPLQRKPYNGLRRH